MANTTTDLPGGDLTDDADTRFQADAVTSGELIATNGLVLKSLVVTSTVAQWIQIHDVNSVPADATVPLVSIFLPANGMISITVPIYTVNGLFICNSSTHGVKTIGAADLMLYGTFKD